MIRSSCVGVRRDKPNQQWSPHETRALGNAWNINKTPTYMIKHVDVAILEGKWMVGASLSGKHAANPWAECWVLPPQLVNVQHNPSDKSRCHLRGVTGQIYMKDLEPLSKSLWIPLNPFKPTLKPMIFWRLHQWKMRETTWGAVRVATLELEGLHAFLNRLLASFGGGLGWVGKSPKSWMVSWKPENPMKNPMENLIYIAPRMMSAVKPLGVHSIPVYTHVQEISISPEK